MFWRLFLLKLHAVCRKTAIFAYKMSNQYKKTTYGEDRQFR